MYIMHIYISQMFMQVYTYTHKQAHTCVGMHTYLAGSKKEKYQSNKDLPEVENWEIGGSDGG